jgi:hypothetical protein
MKSSVQKFVDQIMKDESFDSFKSGAIESSSHKNSLCKLHVNLNGKYFYELIK